jgi:hypothetical protein
MEAVEKWSRLIFLQDRLRHGVGITIVIPELYRFFESFYGAGLVRSANPGLATSMTATATPTPRPKTRRAPEFFLLENMVYSCRSDVPASFSNPHSVF